MRRRIEALADQLEEFVSEDAHDALVIACPDDAVGLIGAAVDLTEQRGSCDVSVSFFGVFEGPDALADALLGHVDAFAAEAGLAPRPRARSASIERVVAGLRHFVGQLRTRGDVRVVLWLCPASVLDHTAYVDTVVALVGACRRSAATIRVAVRADVAELRARLPGVPMLEVGVDLSPAAVRDALADDAADPTLDPSARIALLLSVVMSDAAAGRTEEALPVLATLANALEASGDGSTRALCFVLAGSLLAQRGAIDEARDRVSQGLAIAVEARAVPIVLTGAMLAGHLSMRVGDHADADVRFDVVARLAARAGAPGLIAEALDARADALEARGLPDAARDARTCATEARRRAGGSAVHDHGHHP